MQNKDADQLHGNWTADQPLCFRYIDSAISLFLKLLALFCGCTAPVESDLVGNPDHRFYRNAAHII